MKTLFKTISVVILCCLCAQLNAQSSGYYFNLSDHFLSDYDYYYKFYYDHLSDIGSPPCYAICITGDNRYCVEVEKKNYQQGGSGIPAASTGLGPGAHGRGNCRAPGLDRPGGKIGQKRGTGTHQP